jgi:hypothetical protein
MITAFKAQPFTEHPATIFQISAKKIPIHTLIIRIYCIQNTHQQRK